MTAKEKAKELVNKMVCNIPQHYDEYQQAKDCALICVEEIIESVTSDWVHDKNKEYWQEVKKEIEKL